VTPEELEELRELLEPQGIALAEGEIEEIHQVIATRLNEEGEPEPFSVTVDVQGKSLNEIYDWVRYHTRQSGGVVPPSMVGIVGEKGSEVMT